MAKQTKSVVKDRTRVLAFVLIVIMLASTIGFAASAATVSDVAANHWAYDAVQYALNNGVIGYTSGTYFSPENPAARWVVVQALGKQLGVNAPQTSTGFNDVPQSAPYSGYVKWAVDNGITNGTSTYYFSPDADVERVAVCLFIVRYCNRFGIPISNSTSSPFTDIGGCTSEGREAIGRLYNSGIINGKTATTFDPTGKVTRAELAQILYNINYEYLVVAIARISGLGTWSITTGSGTSQQLYVKWHNGLGSHECANSVSAGVAYWDATGYVQNVSMGSAATAAYKHTVRSWSSWEGWVGTTNSKKWAAGTGSQVQAGTTNIISAETSYNPSFTTYFSYWGDAFKRCLVAHEMGHALGFGHSANSLTVVMRDGNPALPRLTYYEYKGMKLLYG